MRKSTLILLSLGCTIAVYGQKASLNSQEIETRQDTTKLNEIIISENRLQIPFARQSRNIQIVTSEEIKRLPGNSLNEILQSVNGVDIRQRGPFGSQADISIDGGSFEQTLVLVNGVKMADPQTAHHALNLPIPLDAIERIEIIRGPASRIYGINSLTGAINIVTKNLRKVLFRHMYMLEALLKIMKRRHQKNTMEQAHKSEEPGTRKNTIIFSSTIIRNQTDNATIQHPRITNCIIRVNIIPEMLITSIGLQVILTTNLEQTDSMQHPEIKNLRNV